MIATPKLLVGVLLAALLGGVGAYWLGRSDGRQACEAEQTLMELEAWRSEAGTINGTAQLLEGAAKQLAEAKPKVIERYTRVEVQSPLPPGCVRDDGRVRSTVDGFDAAAAARKSRKPLP